MTPETALAVSEFAAGNGAPRRGKGPADEDAPASAPVPVVCGDRAHVAFVDAALANPCDCDAHRYIREQLQDPEFVAAWARMRRREEGSSARILLGVARTLDVAEATADKARAAGLARETAS